MHITTSKQKVIECQKQFDQYNNAWESNNLGNYRLVYSKKNESLYNQYFYCNESLIYQDVSRSLLQKSLKQSQKKVYLVPIIHKII